MKVVVDISPLKTLHKTRGIGIYTRRLIEALQQYDKKNEYVLTTKFKDVSGADVVHYPYFDLFFHTLPIRKHTKTVVTIHDLTPLIFPSDFHPGIKGRYRYFLQRLALRSVNAVITDSENSKRDIKQILNVPDQKLSVIYLAAADSFRPQNDKQIQKVKKRYKLPDKFALYVGDVNANKNIIKLVNAFKRLVKKHTNLHLVLVGSTFKDKKLPQVVKIIKEIENISLQSKVLILPNVTLDPPDDLAAIYCASQVYIQPSLYEGFGLPVLEAFASGTLVVSSNSSSLPEITGEAAIMVNPKSSTEISKGIVKALNLSNDEKAKLVRKGIKQANKFSWKKTAEETIEVYKSVVERL